MMKTKIIILSLHLLMMFNILAQESQRSIIVFFRSGVSKIEMEYNGNQRNLDEFITTIKALKADTSYLITKLAFEGYASPEGTVNQNQHLFNGRVSDLVKYIQSRVAIPDNMIESRHDGISWERLSELVKASKIDHKDELLKIINDNSESANTNEELVDNRLQRLKEFNSGHSYKQLLDIFFPQMRYAKAEIYFRKKSANKIVDNIGNRKVLIQDMSTNTKPVEPNSVPETIQKVAKQELHPVVERPDKQILPVTSTDNKNKITAEFEKQPFLAVKTNLLYDLALMPNIAIEVPIRKHWSVGAEWIFPWWLSTKKQYCLEIMSGNIEIKHWFGNQPEKKRLTGWFAGVSAGGGIYDVEWNKKGYQGDFYIMGGLVGGYSHSIGKNLRLEYSLGAGYIETRYTKYNAVMGVDCKWHLIKEQYKPRYGTILPTKIEVSLVWILNRKIPKGGVR